MVRPMGERDEMTEIKTYTVEIEDRRGLWVVASSTIPGLHVTAASRAEMMEILPRVVEHLYADKNGKTVHVQLVNEDRRSWWHRILALNVGQFPASRNSHRELATLSLTI